MGVTIMFPALIVLKGKEAVSVGRQLSAICVRTDRHWTICCSSLSLEDTSHNLRARHLPEDIYTFNDMLRMIQTCTWDRVGVRFPQKQENSRFTKCPHSNKLSDCHGTLSGMEPQNYVFSATKTVKLMENL